jgi:hypothetical protein
MPHSLEGSTETEGHILRGHDGGWTVVLQPATDLWRLGV